MDETEKYIRSLIKQQGFTINERSEEAFLAFASTEENTNHVKSIRLLQEKMTKSWQLVARREDINTIQVAFPNGIVGKEYKAEFSFSAYGLGDITSYTLTGFEGSGLKYVYETRTINGIPENSGDICLTFNYNFEGEPEDAQPNTKQITIIINPDPKSLWKDIPSDQNDLYAKADKVAETATFIGQTLLAVSKRGRSHANKGSFRDDDYAFTQLSTGWGIICLADGAGSATYSRKGSLLACEAVIDYFTENFTKLETVLLEEAIEAYTADDTLKNKVLDIAYPHLSAAAKNAFAVIKTFADAAQNPINDYHATLSFALVRKYPKGCAFLSFGVGDCPIAIIDKSFGWIKPLNMLDVGEFGGGTRFITMPEIFANDIFEDRFNFEFTKGFPYLVLMSDGIYDPKFEVEANLSKPEKWKAFFDDLGGNNGEQLRVALDAGNEDMVENISAWTDFWSPGNHDDRTLIVVF